VEDLLALNHDLSRDQFPMPVKPTNDHKETLMEMSNLGDLMLELVP
jgi:hypothetical protein